MYRFKSRQ